MKTFSWDRDDRLIDSTPQITTYQPARRVPFIWRWGWLLGVAYGIGCVLFSLTHTGKEGGGGAVFLSGLTWAALSIVVCIVFAMIHMKVHNPRGFRSVVKTVAWVSYAYAAYRVAVFGARTFYHDVTDED
jgi:hypothetical protein